MNGTRGLRAYIDYKLQSMQQGDHCPLGEKGGGGHGGSMTWNKHCASPCPMWAWATRMFRGNYY